MKEERKKVLVMIVLFAAVISISVYAGSLMKVKKQYTGDDFDAFKAGYHDSYITLIGNIISNCTPSPLYVFQNIGYDNRAIGILFRCEKPDMNVSFPIKYSRYARG